MTDRHYGHDETDKFDTIVEAEQRGDVLHFSAVVLDKRDTTLALPAAKEDG